MSDRNATHATPKKRAPASPPPKRDWRPPFLESLRATGDPASAARSAGTTVRKAKAARSSDDELAAAWHEAVEAWLAEAKASYDALPLRQRRSMRVTTRMARDGRERLISASVTSVEDQRQAALLERLEKGGLLPPGLDD